MKALLFAVLLAVPLTLVPPAGAWYAVHFAAGEGRCMAAGAVEVPNVLIECPVSHHFGYAESLGCTGDVCTTEIWIEAWASGSDAVSVTTTVREPLSVTAQTLCEAEGEQGKTGCEAEGAPFEVTLADGGCTALVFETTAGNEIPWISRAHNELTACRYGNELEYHGPADAEWFAGSRLGCDEASPAAPVMGSFCNVQLSGVASVLSCDATTCDVWTLVGGSARGSWWGPATLKVSVDDTLLCIDAQQSAARCQGHAIRTLEVAPGACRTLVARADALSLLDGSATAISTFDVCRDADGAASIVNAGWE